jgi:hypothetical protein
MAATKGLHRSDRADAWNVSGAGGTQRLARTGHPLRLGADEKRV